MLRVHLRYNGHRLSLKAAKAEADKAKAKADQAKAKAP